MKTLWCDKCGNAMEVDSDFRRDGCYVTCTPCTAAIFKAAGLPYESADTRRQKGKKKSRRGKRQ